MQKPSAMTFAPHLSADAAFRLACFVGLSSGALSVLSVNGVLHILHVSRNGGRDKIEP